MDWRVTGILQEALSNLPLGVAANDLIRIAIGGPRRLDREITAKVEADWLVLMDHLKVSGVRPQGLDYLEVGTGWYPTLPLCFALAGARSCHTFDISRHLNGSMTIRLVRALALPG